MVTLPKLSAFHGSLALNTVVAVPAFAVSASEWVSLAEHLHAPHAWTWPLFVDGFVLAGTLAAFKMVGHRAYAWSMLGLGAVLSLLGNGLSAWLLTGSWLSVAFSTVPTLVLLAITHTTLLLWAEHKEATTVKKPVKRALRKAAVKKPVAVPAAKNAPAVPAAA
ncbi:hypothetical protein [Nocardia brasiliensis]|uniref:hypothetical protein n=1 Tax=Nocardia brasiliensis TaxID=37326 RepID=UPI002455E7B7|nr:hypothetical protein [Nocardia brasiliensis]